MSLSSVHKYIRCIELMKEYSIEYTLYTDCFKLVNCRGMCLGNFNDVDNLYWYLLGYQSGIIDNHK